ncbi:MAG: restriction endonuclease subunit S [Panacagrimonas sp.]
MIGTSVRVKFICRLGYGDSLPKDEESDGGVPVFGSNGKYASTSAKNTDAPAIVVGRKGSYGKVNWAPEGCFASDTTFFVDEHLTAAHLRWLYWSLQTLRLDEGSQEAAVPGLNRESVYEERIYLPSTADQVIIANYLDRETARIDGLIAEKKRMLALLEEKRAALISRVVTRGLDPNAPLKPSGQDWLGEIPAHWRAERAKNLFTIRDERSDDGSEELLTVSHITGVTSRSEKDVYMFEADDKAGYKRCMPGDLAINTLWAWMGAMGISPLAGIVSPDYHVYTSKGDLLPEYVDLMCRSLPFVAEVSRWSKGVWSSRLRLYPENFFEMRLPVPPHNEQRDVVRAVASDQRKANALRDSLQISITLAKERRAALITAAVTSQIPLEEMAA